MRLEINYFSSNFIPPAIDDKGNVATLYRLCKLCHIEKLSGTTHTLLNLFSTANLDKLGKFIVLAFNKRQRIFDDVSTSLVGSQIRNLSQNTCFIF